MLNYISVHRNIVALKLIKVESKIEFDILFRQFKTYLNTS